MTAAEKAAAALAVEELHASVEANNPGERGERRVGGGGGGGGII